MKNQKTVVLGLSGGVDSAVAALLLKKKYNVIAAFMKNFSDNKNPLTGECNWVEEKQMAQRIAAILEIPFHTFDFEKEYKKQVLDRMYSEYKKGLTPNPDISCNTIIKFPLFWKHAKKLGADYIAMGHYAQIKNTKTGFQLLAGKDKFHDQSYFLSELNQSDLSHTLFPIGKLTKEQVRNIAKENNFPNWNKRGTRGICFVGKVPFKKFLEKKIPNKSGKVLDPNNNVLGSHEGIQYYTVGQRIGPHLGIQVKKEKEDNKKWYIAKKLKNNTLIVVPEHHALLKCKTIVLNKLHLINKKGKIPKQLKARIRHLGQLHPGKLKANKFILSKPLEAVAPGQFIVLYNKNRIIASGEISNTY